MANDVISRIWYIITGIVLNNNYVKPKKVTSFFRVIFFRESTTYILKLWEFHCCHGNRQTCATMSTQGMYNSTRKFDIRCKNRGITIEV